jgi:hypothetical protein
LVVPLVGLAALLVVGAAVAVLLTRRSALA